jgi:hypothetical protein
MFNPCRPRWSQTSKRHRRRARCPDGARLLHFQHYTRTSIRSIIHFVLGYDFSRKRELTCAKVSAQRHSEAPSCGISFVFNVLLKGKQG